MNKQVFKDAFNLLCGDQIAEGEFRRVFECALNPDLVVKVEMFSRGGVRTWDNVLESDFWHSFKNDPPIRKWLAPCQYLSPEGWLLMQDRCDPIPRSFKLPNTLPTFLTDIKRSNFGLLSGRLVCLDYGFVNLQPSLRLRKIHWGTNQDETRQ